MKYLITLIALCILSLNTHAVGKMNIPVLTVDDMNCDFVGVYVCTVPGTTPKWDKFVTCQQPKLQSCRLKPNPARVAHGEVNPKR